MRLTTLCYAENRGRWLMMHRVRKNQDENAGKWIGLGGHMLDGESPEECVRREFREEAGLELSGLRLRGILTFILPDWGNELTFLYTAQAADLPLPDCNEGVLRWIPFDEADSLPLWEGDRIFLPLLRSREDVFSLKLIYAPGGKLMDSILESPLSESRPYDSPAQWYEPDPQPGPASPENGPDPFRISRLTLCGNQCCICGADLSRGFAPLFRLQDGREARIDDGCWNAVNAVYNSGDPQLVSQAVRFLQGRILSVDPDVIPYLQEYIKVGTQRCGQSSP